MKRNFAIVVALVVVALAFCSPPARAQNAHSAFVIRDFMCFIPDATCTTGFPIMDNSTTAVVTNSGFSKVSCQAKLPAGATLPTQGKVLCDFNSSGGMQCQTATALTNDWQATVSPSGRVNFQCFVH